MMRSLYSGVSGLEGHQTRMDVIGNNIANVNTIGFKASRVTFADTLSQTLRGSVAPQGQKGGVNALQVGLGVNIASIDVLQTQGSPMSTGNLTDLGIQGDGYFILNDGATNYYTRAGNFILENGHLVSASNGLAVQGWIASQDGTVDTNGLLKPIEIMKGQTMPARATTKATFGGNLNQNANGDPNYAGFTVTDAAGHSATVEIMLTATGFNKFHYKATSSSGEVVGGEGDIILDADGKVISITGGNFTVTPSEGSAITIAPPLVGAASGGAFQRVDPTSTLQFSGLSIPGTVTKTLTDVDGNSFDVIYSFTGSGFPAAGTYNWTAAVVDPTKGTLVSGGSGSVSWDGTTFTGGTGNAVFASVVNPTQQITTTAPSTSGATLTFDVTNDYTASTVAAANYTPPKAASASLEVFDSLGASHVITTTFTKIGENKWAWSSQVDGGLSLTGNSGELTFNDNGQLLLATGGPLTFAPVGAQPVTIQPSFSGFTQYKANSAGSASNTANAGDSELNTPTQDGYAMGTLQDISIDTSGRIVGAFSNGQNQTVAQIAVANFNNPSGLIQYGNSLLMESNNSGVAQIGAAGQGGRGSMTPGSLEMSNVDLAQQFTDMIVTQRGFQANSKIITTSDEMLQDLVNLKR